MLKKIIYHLFSQPIRVAKIKIYVIFSAVSGKSAGRSGKL